MQRLIKRGAAADHGLIFHVFVQDTAYSDGRGKTGLGFADFTVHYVLTGKTLSAAITTETVTTLGTYAPPTSVGHIRIRELSAADAPGIYEVHIHATWVAVTDTPQSLTILLTATGAAALPIQIPLGYWSPQDEIGTVAEITTSVEGSQVGIDAASAVSTLSTLVVDLVAAVEADVIDGVTIANICKVILATLAGKTDNFGTTDPKHFRNPGDTVDRVTATTDAQGNRTAITLNFA